MPPLFPGFELLQEGPAEDDDEARLLRESICKTCSAMSASTLEAFRMEVWNEIPKIFDLGSWDDVKRSCASVGSE